MLTRGGVWNFDLLEKAQEVGGSAHCPAASRSFVRTVACPSCEWLTSLGRENNQNKADGLGFIQGVVSPSLTRRGQQITAEGHGEVAQVSLGSGPGLSFVISFEELGMGI